MYQHSAQQHSVMSRARLSLQQGFRLAKTGQRILKVCSCKQALSKVRCVKLEAKPGYSSPLLISIHLFILLYTDGYTVLQISPALKASLSTLMSC